MLPLCIRTCSSSRPPPPIDERRDSVLRCQTSNMMESNPQESCAIFARREERLGAPLARAGVVQDVTNASLNHLHQLRLVRSDTAATVGRGVGSRTVGLGLSRSRSLERVTTLLLCRVDPYRLFSSQFSPPWDV